MKNNYKNWPRYLLQWGVLILLLVFFTGVFGTEKADPEAYCPFGGLQTLATYLQRGSMVCSMTATQVLMGVILAVCVILFSKLFCGYLCPLGTIGEFMAYLRRKLRIKEWVIRQGGLADRLLRVIKYALLFWIGYMTISSSELFCKNMDPYYALATGMKGEITLWMAWISLGLLFLGSFFVKMFWCKYICPLGALSHIFKFTLTAVFYVVVFWGLSAVGVNVSWVWLLFAVCLTCYVWEMIYMRSRVFPLLAVVRKPEDCTHCGLCEKQCPYHINITELGRVKAVDCTLCGECMTVCRSNALSVNGKAGLRWLPVVLVLLLLPLGLWLGNKIELPTIDERWGDGDKTEHLESFRMEGLKSVKCFGSSKAFSAQLQKIPGVYGVATYVKKHWVEIYYQDHETTPEKIREALYVPAKFKIATPPESVDSLRVITIRTDKMFDKLDLNYLGMKFRNTQKAYYGLESEYGCPLTVRVYMDPAEPVDEDFMRSTVEAKELVIKAAEKETVIPTAYKYVSMEEGYYFVGRRAFLESQFKAYAKVFTPKDATLPQAIYQVGDMGLDKPIVTRFLPAFTSHLSGHDGIVFIKTLLDEHCNPVLQIGYIPSVMSEARLRELLAAPKWNVKYTSGETKEEDPKFKIPEGRTL